jgi:tetratricopeptide (TPR) repeat protein
MPRPLVALMLALAVASSTKVALADEAERARRMASGQKLLSEESFEAARAEFEAAYEAKPKADALTSIAACERALFRLPQAIAALERALAEHGASMSEADRKGAEASLAELRAQIGFASTARIKPRASRSARSRSPLDPIASKPASQATRPRRRPSRSRAATPPR